MLNVVILDMLWEEETGMSKHLQAAHQSGALPIETLTLLRRLPQEKRRPGDCWESCHVFMSAFREISPAHVSFARFLRREKPSIFIVFAVDKAVDIRAFARPSIQPAGILYIPLDKRTVYQTIREIYQEYLRMEEKDAPCFFTMRSGGEYFRIDIDEIFCFEAQGKKIALKTRGQEIAFYSSFETVMLQLPDWFLRCHKGYIVNTRRIAQARYADMMLILQGGCAVPFSRSHKDEIRALLKGS